MKKIILLISITILSTTAKSENIQELLNTKKCIFNNDNFTYQSFGIAGVFYKIGNDLNDFNQSIKNQYNLGFTQGSIVNIQLPIDIKNTITTTDDKIQYYQLCYKLEKI